jgi:hypothetical protein
MLIQKCIVQYRISIYMVLFPLSLLFILYNKGLKIPNIGLNIRKSRKTKLPIQGFTSDVGRQWFIGLAYRGCWVLPQHDQYTTTTFYLIFSYNVTELSASPLRSTSFWSYPLMIRGWQSSGTYRFHYFLLELPEVMLCFNVKGFVDETIRVINWSFDINLNMSFYKGKWNRFWMRMDISMNIFMFLCKWIFLCFTSHSSGVIIIINCLFNLTLLISLNIAMINGSFVNKQ